MAFTRISLKSGKSPEYKQALMDGLYRAMRETFDVPEDDRFMMVHEHGEGEFSYGADFYGIQRSDALIFIQITGTDSRSLETKKRFYKRATAVLTETLGLRPEDVFINLVEVKKENWSFGHGDAQYA